MRGVVSGDRSFIVSWSSPTRPGGRILSYTVSWRVVESQVGGGRGREGITTVAGTVTWVQVRYSLSAFYLSEYIIICEFFLLKYTLSYMYRLVQVSVSFVYKQIFSICFPILKYILLMHRHSHITVFIIHSTNSYVLSVCLWL